MDPHNTPLKPMLPSPPTPLSPNSSGVFFEDPPTPKTPVVGGGNKGGVFENFEKTVGTVLKRKNTLTKMREKLAMEELDQESEKIRESNNPKKTFEDYYPDQYQMEEGEERRYIDPKAEQDTLVQELVTNLQNWINDELGEGDTRMRVNNLAEDLHDGLILKKLMENLSGTSIQMPLGELVQSEERQRRNLTAILNQIQQMIGIEPGNRWSVESIFDKNQLSNLHLLLAMVSHYSKKGRVFIDLPKSLRVDIIVVSKTNGHMQYERKSDDLITSADSRDGFDTLIDHAPEKIHFVTQSLTQFANSYLGKLNRKVDDLQSGFSDGVNLLLLLGMLGGFYIPLYEYHPTPSNYEEKIHNVQMAFDLLVDQGITPRNRAADVVRGDIKAILRLIYALFVKYNGPQ